MVSKTTRSINYSKTEALRFRHPNSQQPLQVNSTIEILKKHGRMEEETRGHAPL